MAVVNTGLLARGLRSEFFNRFKAAATWYQELATRIVSNGDGEKYRWLGTVPQMRRWGTGRVAKGLRSESYSIDNCKYEATLEVDRDEVADDQTGQIRVRIGELAERAATHKDYLLAGLIANGESAEAVCYDGVPFFAEDHASGDSGVQNNKLSFDAADADNPTQDEFRGSLRQAMTRLLSFKDDRGEPMPVAAGGLYCVVPPSMYFAALEAIHATVINNTTNVLEGMAKVVALPWLADDSKWYLLKNNGVVRPFIFQDREPIELNSLTEDSEELFKREKYLFGVRARYAMAYGYWQYAVRTQFVG